MTRFLANIFFIVAVSVSLQAQEVGGRLFEDDGRAVNNYDSRVQNIIEHFEARGRPIRVQFSKDVSFDVVACLGRGGQHVILDTGDGYVIRIRKEAFQPDSLLIYITSIGSDLRLVDSMENYWQAYLELARNNVNVPETLDIPEHRQKFLRQKKIDIEMDYDAYIQGNSPKDLQDKMDAALLIFAASTSMFRNIGDFRGDQLVFTKSGEWMLIDFHKPHIYAKSPADGNIFEMDWRDIYENLKPAWSSAIMIEKPEMPYQLREQLLKVIKEARQKNGCGNLLKKAG